MHGARNLDPRDVTVHRGIPVTTVERTLVDLTDTLIAEELTNVIHEAAFRRRFSIPATREAMAAPTAAHNLARLDEAIELWLAGSAGLKSRLERAFLQLVVDAGLRSRSRTSTSPVPRSDRSGPISASPWRSTGRTNARRPSIVADESETSCSQRAEITVLRFTEFELERRPGGRARRARQGRMSFSVTT